MTQFEAVAPEAMHERALLATIIRNNDVLDRIGSIEAEDLIDPDCQVMLAEAVELRASGKPITLLALSLRCRKVFSGEDDLREHLLTMGASESGEDAIAAVAEGIQRRKIQTALEQASAWNLSDASMAPSALIEEVLREFDGLHDQQTTKDKTVWTMAETATFKYGTEPPECIKTGVEALDAGLGGGFLLGKFYVGGGRPGMCKSVFGQNILRRAAARGWGVVIFSIEMTAHEIAPRMAADAAWTRNAPIHYEAAERCVLNDHDLKRFQAARVDVEKLPVIIDYGPLTVAEIASRTRRYKAKFAREGIRLGLIVIDHLGIVPAGKRYAGNRTQELAEISSGVARIAKLENIAVLGLHQLNRQVEGRDNKRPTLSDLRDSGAMEQDADVVLFFYRPAYYLQNYKYDDPEKDQQRQEMLERKLNDLEVIVAKNRSGRTGTINLFVDVAANAIRNKQGAF